ncbi:AAA family ATPase, partial [bacterium]|nr:AAA family ATPase [bacterium]
MTGTHQATIPRIIRLRWLKLVLDAFGGVAGSYALPPDRLTILTGRNEAGKSTILAALAGALYG